LTIVQHFPNVTAAMAHGVKPLYRHGAKRTLVFIPPTRDAGMAIGCAVEPK
jgi:hypothetical protein